jgi:DNA polymerase III gamma/tau subunit
LEEVVVSAGRKNITAELVNEKFNNSGIADNVSQMLEALSEKDARKGIAICKELANQGMDFKFFIEELMGKLHLLLLQKVGVEKTDKETVLELAEIRKLFQLLTTAYLETKTAVLAQMPLELVVLEWVGEEQKNNGVFDSPHVVGDAHDKRGPVADFPPASARSRLTGLRAVGSSSIGTTPQASTFDSPQSGLSPASFNSRNSFFEKLIDEVKAENHLVAGVLRGCSAEEIQAHKLKIVAKSKFHQEKLQEAKTLKLLEEAADKITGEKLNIQIILGGDK